MTDLVLELVEGPSAGRRIVVDRAIELGRASRTGTRLTDEHVSRHHAHVEPDGDGLKITDLHSTNGTHVDGRAIAGPRHVRAGDTIRLGITVLRVRRADELPPGERAQLPRPDMPSAAGVLQPAAAEELSAADLEAQEDAIIRAQEMQLTVVPAGGAAIGIGAIADAAHAPGAPDGAGSAGGPLSRIIDAQVGRQARLSAILLLSTSVLALLLYYLIR